MSPLEFMQASIERPVCGGQIRWFYVCRGSAVTRRVEGEQSFDLAVTRFDVNGLRLRPPPRSPAMSAVPL